METEQNNLDRIDAYLEGKLHGDSLKAFNEELNTNDELKKALELQKNIRKAINKQGNTALRKDLEKYHQEWMQVNARKKILRLVVPVISIAASIIILLFIFNGEKGVTNKNDEIITLDTTGINKTPEYADSAVYKPKDDKDSVELKIKN